MLRRRRVLISISLLLGLALVGFATVLWTRRLELFVLPGKLEQAVEAGRALRELGANPGIDRQTGEPRVEKIRAAADERQRAVVDLLATQATDFPAIRVAAFRSVRTLDGATFRVVGYGLEGAPDAAVPWSPGSGDTSTLISLAVDPEGKIRGRSFAALRASCHQLPFALTDSRRPYELFAAFGDVGSSVFAVDREGVVPLGVWFCVTRGQPESAEQQTLAFPVSTAISREAREWLTFDGEPIPGESEIRRRLASSRMGDLFRALYAIERSGSSRSSLATPLLDDSKADIRARAAAVCGNDPAMAVSIAPLLDDADLRVRRAAIFALLNAQDLRIARTAFLRLCGLEERLLSSSLVPSELILDADSLWSPDALHTLLDRLRASPASVPTVALRFDGRFGDLPGTYPDGRTLGACAPRLLEHWSRLEKEEYDEPTLRAILGAWIAATPHPRAEGLSAALLTSIAEKESMPLDIVAALLDGLAARSAPLSSPTALAALDTIARWQNSQGTPIELAIRARYLLAGWKIGRSREELLELLATENGRDDVSDFHAQPFAESFDAKRLRLVPPELLSEIRKLEKERYGNAPNPDNLDEF